MGGQTCVFYGAAKFSRDSDFAILVDPENLARLDNALKHLQTGVIGARLSTPPSGSGLCSIRDHIPHIDRILFWLRELRTPELLLSVCEQYPELAAQERVGRPLLGIAPELLETRSGQLTWPPDVSELAAAHSGR